MNKIVIFDWGGVVVNHENNLQDINEAKIRLIKSFNKSIKDEEILLRWTDTTSEEKIISTVNDDKSINDWINKLQNAMNIDVPIEDFKIRYQEEFGKIRYYKDVVEYIHSLKGQCDIGILSNLGALDKTRLDEQLHLRDFNYCFLSFEMGIKKPNIRIYQTILEQIKTEPKNILFIDDNEENILAAKECGLNTCQAFGYELAKIKTSVDKFLSDNWELVFDEKFKNLDNWNFEYGFVRNNELQYYTDKNYILDKNGLTIVGKLEKVKNDNYNSKSDKWQLNREYAEVTSTSINTKNKFSFKTGYIEAKIKMPIGNGVWPAFWLLGTDKDWPDGGEIDIMEYLGRTKDVVYHNAHSKNHISKLYNSCFETIENTTTEYHTYGLYKDEDILEFYVDRKIQFRLVRKLEYDLTDDWPFNDKFYIILNLALGGDWARDLDLKCLPAYYNILYVKVWEK